MDRHIVDSCTFTAYLQELSVRGSHGQGQGLHLLDVFSYIIRFYHLPHAIAYKLTIISFFTTSNSNGTVQPNYADVPLRNYSLTH